MGESFTEFFECWLMEQGNRLEELVQATEEGQNEEHVERVLVPLVQGWLKQYEYYYKTKSEWAKNEVFAMLHPSWLSSLEDGFLWIGGFRPSMAFHLLYSKTGLQLEARLAELLEGIEGNDLSELTAAQMQQIDELQGRTIREEREITEKMAELQETVADPSLVELSHVVSELMRKRQGEDGNKVVEEEEENRVESTLAPKEAGMVEILRSADDLRFRTLKGILQILSTIQSVHFLIAVAELHLRVHDWGKKRDDAHAMQP